MCSCMAFAPALLQSSAESRAIDESVSYWEKAMDNQRDYFLPSNVLDVAMQKLLVKEKILQLRKK